MWKILMLLSIGVQKNLILETLNTVFLFLNSLQRESRRTPRVLILTVISLMRSHLKRKWWQPHRQKGQKECQTVPSFTPQWVTSTSNSFLWSMFVFLVILQQFSLRQQYVYLFFFFCFSGAPKQWRTSASIAGTVITTATYSIVSSRYEHLWSV